MPKSEEINKIEIKSEELQEIFGITPSWITRSGIGVILLVILVLLVGSWFFKYPDILNAKIVVSTENPPASLVAMSRGEITHLFVKEKQIVRENELIAIIENTSNHEDVIRLGNLLKLNTSFNSFPQLEELKLGEIQQSYSHFLKLLNDYKSFKKLDYYSQRMASIGLQKSDYQNYYNKLLKQLKTKEKHLQLAGLQLDRDEKLFEKGVYSKSEFEKAEKQYLEEKLSYENMNANLASIQIEINQLDQQILDLKLQEIKEFNQQKTSLNESLANLKSQIALWEQKYLIKTPISGIVTFNKIWSKNQNIKTGELVATVIPKEANKKIGRLSLPAAGFGKIKIGQIVNVKLDNYPHMEFGMLKCKVKSISLVPLSTENGAIYTVEIELPNDLITNYDKKLSFSQEMTGSAEIITEDIRLLERILYPIKSIWRNNINQ